MTTSEPTQPTTTADDNGEGRPMKAALEKLVNDGTLTKEQAQAVRQAVKDARREHKGERHADKQGATPA